MKSHVMSLVYRSHRVDSLASRAVLQRWLSSLATLDRLCDSTIEACTADLPKLDKSSATQKKRRKIKIKAKQRVHDFYNHYKDAYGEERWSRLCKALLGPTRTAALVNQFVKYDIIAESLQKQEARILDRIPWCGDLEAYWIDQGKSRLEPPSPIHVVEETISSNREHGITEENVENRGLMDYYCLDPSSLLPVLALGLSTAGDEPKFVLDLCAAPGGKALAILQALSSEETLSDSDMVVLNEYSDARRKRLRKVLDQYVPPGLVDSSVFVTGRDGISFGKVKGDISYGVKHKHFSHILCDVPCSGERHVIQNGRALGEWRLGISRKNQKRQVALLKAAISGCRPGGTIVYSTCSIAPDENDDIIEKVASKREGMVDIVPNLCFDVGEPTSHGWIVLPEHPSCAGMGPMYIAVLRRKA